MKKNLLISTLMLIACTLFTSNLSAQSNPETTEAEIHPMDTVQAREEAEQLNTRHVKDKIRMTDLKRDRRETKAKAKEAQRVGREASAASRESNSAYKSEKRAQKARRQADKQALKASKAQTKSDANSN